MQQSPFIVGVGIAVITMCAAGNLISEETKNCLRSNNQLLQAWRSTSSTKAQRCRLMAIALWNIEGGVAAVVLNPASA